MSRRHRTGFAPLSSPEIEAHRRAERQRVRAELAGARAIDPHEIEPPSVEYRPPRHRDPERVRRRDPRHWKQPFWKRRSTMRRARARAELQPRAIT